MKIRAMNPALSWLQAYAMAGQQGAPRETKAEEPPKTAKPPKRTSARKGGKGKDAYERAFSMDLEELEAKLFS